LSSVPVGIVVFEEVIEVVEVILAFMGSQLGLALKFPPSWASLTANISFIRASISFAPAVSEVFPHDPTNL
jgi:hypothetical protein